jgi:hypothetical protein
MVPILIVEDVGELMKNRVADLGTFCLYEALT